MTYRFLMVLLGCLMLSTLTLAQDDATKAQAREQFNQGIAQYEASQYDAALESFQEAYRLSPHPMVRVNMANCYDRLGKPVEALFHFERFMSETEGDRSRAAQRSEVQSAIRRLKGSLGELQVRVIPDGSMVRVDETDERRSPILEPIILAAGDHVVVVTRPGFARTERRVQVRGGATETLNITLEREAVAAAPLPAPTPRPVIAPLPEEEDVAEPAPSEEMPVAPAPEEAAEAQAASWDASTEEAAPGDGARSSSIWTPPVIIASVVSGTFLIGSALMGLRAMKADADFEGFKEQSRNPALSDRDQEAARRSAVTAAESANDRALAADLLFAGALISGAAALFFVLTQDDAEADPDLALQLGPTGAALSGRF